MQDGGHDPVVLLCMGLQVRQPLYNSSVARWRVYEQQLRPLQQRLQPLIREYEQLLQQHSAMHGAGDAQTTGTTDGQVVPEDVATAAHDEGTVVDGSSILHRDEL